LDSVHDLLPDDDGLLYHVLAPGAAPSVRGLLGDQVAYARALLDAHEISGEARFLARARSICDLVIARFEAEDGGFYDRLPAEESFGRLAFPDRPIVENGSFADVLLRLAALTNVDYRKPAQGIFRLYAGASESSGSFAAAYTRALRRYLTPELTVRIVGDAAATDAFREAALRLPSPFTTLRTLPPAVAAEFELPAEPQPAAYVCSSDACSAPVTEAGAVRAAYETLTLRPHVV
jgi:hypothetical protein